MPVIDESILFFARLFCSAIVLFIMEKKLRKYKLLTSMNCFFLFVHGAFPLPHYSWPVTEEIISHMVCLQAVVQNGNVQLKGNLNPDQTPGSGLDLDRIKLTRPNKLIFPI